MLSYVLVAIVVAIASAALTVLIMVSRAQPDPVKTRAQRLGRLWARASAPLLARRQNPRAPDVTREPITMPVPVLRAVTAIRPAAQPDALILAALEKHFDVPAVTPTPFPRHRAVDVEETVALPAVVARHTGPIGRVAGVPLGIHTAR